MHRGSCGPGRPETSSDREPEPRAGNEVALRLALGRQQRGWGGVEVETTVRTASALRLVAWVHDHFQRAHSLLQRCGAQPAARSHRDARRRRRRWSGRTRRTRRTRRQLGWRRLGQGRWRRIWRRRKLGFEDPRHPDPGFHRAHGAGGDWPIGTQRPGSRPGLVGSPHPRTRVSHVPSAPSSRGRS
jgi:hypothetical protein